MILMTFLCMRCTGSQVLSIGYFFLYQVCSSRVYYIREHTHTHTSWCTNTYAHTRAHARTHTHTHTHTHSVVLTLSKISHKVTNSNEILFVGCLTSQQHARATCWCISGAVQMRGRQTTWSICTEREGGGAGVEGHQMKQLLVFNTQLTLWSSQGDREKTRLRYDWDTDKCR